MPELLRPDVYVEEVSSPPGIPQIPTSTGAFVGVADRGPVDLATFVDSFTTYWNRFGGYRSDSYLTYAVEGFFNNGGSRCYVVRASNPDGSPAPAVADLDIADMGADLDAFTVACLDVGAFGSMVNAGTTHFETILDATEYLTGVPAAPTTSLVVADASGFNRGDIIYVDDGTTQIVAVVHTINLGTNTLTFGTSVTPGAIIANTARVATSSMHRVTTGVTEAIPTGSVTSIKVVNARNFRVGQMLTICDKTTQVDLAVVTGINGNEILITSTSMTPGFATIADVLVSSQEFILRIWDQNTVIQPFEFLSTSPTNKQDYVENRLSGDSNESNLIEMTQGTSSSAGILELPAPIASTPLAGGLDGAAPGDSDYVGTLANARGLHALDKTTDINFITVPGITTTTVQQGGVDYAASSVRQDVIFLVDPPLASDEATEIRDWRLNTLNRDSSYGALYYPWIQINDPEADGQTLSLPPSGHVMGIYSAVARDSGPHTPPANIAISGVNGVTHLISDSEHDILNPIGVNVIRGYPGEGIRVMGSRTLQTAQDGKHYVNVRNLTNFIKKSLKIGLRAYLQRAIDPRLWDQIGNTCRTFMLRIWRDGWLFPSDNQGQAFSVKCDRENNTQDIIDQGRVNVSVGYNPPYPAEFIVLRLSRIGGNVEVSE
jgi:phage tail sheath protein FI